MTAVSHRLGIDVGGTFTDLVLVGPDGEALTRKVLSATDDYATAIIAGTLELLDGGRDRRRRDSARSCTGRPSPRTPSSSAAAPRPGC